MANSSALSAKLTPSIVILGAGAMGCLFAARLAKQGAEVTLVDVDLERLSTIARDGITLLDDEGTNTYAVRAALAADVSAPIDLLILFTKGMHSAAAIQSVRHLTESKPVALTLQNGIGNAELLAETFGAEQVLMGTAHVPADLTGPASVETHGFGSLEIGWFADKTDFRARQIAEMLHAAGFGTAVSADINASVWEKVAFNAALNAMAMICEVANAGMDNDPGLRIAKAVVEETANVAAAAGIQIDKTGIIATIKTALVEHAHHKASMLQDRDQGRQTEIDMINGAIAKEGARLGVPTPVCDTLSDLVRVIELKDKA